MKLLMRYFFVSVLLILSVAVHAQTKLHYSALLEASFLKGNSQNSNAFLFANGVAYKSWAAGIGAGIDSYVFRSVPVFADVRKSFGHRHLQPFVNASAGINCNAVKDNQKFLYNSYPDVHYINGFYAKAAAGISLPVHKRLRVFAEAGYRFKTTKVMYTSYVYTTEEMKTINTDSYRFNCWSVAAGFWF